MALLPQDQGSQLKLFVAILAVAAGALYLSFVHNPGGLELVELTDRVDNLETQNRLAETRVGNLQRLRDDLSAAERQLEVLERLVPESSEVAEIYEAIASETQSLSLELMSIEPLAPTPADSAGSLVRQEWSLIVQGTYHAIGRFLTNVASFERIVRPRVSEVVPAGSSGSGRQLVQASLILETFVLGAGEPQTGGAAAGSGSNADGAPGGLVE